MIKIKKSNSALRPSSKPDALDEEDKLDVIKQEYQLAQDSLVDYAYYKTEMEKYRVELPVKPDFKDLSKINKLYAIAQSYSSRVTAIEVEAIDNHSRWERLVNYMAGYIDDKHFKLLTRPDIAEMTNMKAEAAVKVALAKEQQTLRKFKDKENEAASFMRMVITKKKDLTSVLQTLGKQVSALSLEHSTIRQ